MPIDMRRLIGAIEDLLIRTLVRRSGSRFRSSRTFGRLTSTGTRSS